jgi:hypothetical protein
MDGSHFDALTRTLTTGGSRRRALTGLVGGTLGLFAASVEETAAKNCNKFKNKAKRKQCLKKAKVRSCTPNCDRKICGSDGCGGSCGTCAGNEACQNGRCVCVPACGGKECGDDGCGDSCGSCSAPLTCPDGGLCSCPLNVPDFCQGDCWPACYAARNPGTCECCLFAGLECQTNGDCCGGWCSQVDEKERCRGLASGEQCEFDAQCQSGDCRDSGLQAGKCA